MRAHQLPQLPPFEQFWESLTDVFEWLEGRRALPVLPHAVGTRGRRRRVVAHATDDGVVH